ncbi:MAG: sulfatase [Bdellovibrionota bacterium]
MAINITRRLFLNTLIDNSILFKNFYSTSSYTAPATASLFTSLYQKDHGVKIGFIHSKRDNKSKFKLNRIPEDVLTMTELFKDAQYDTFGVADNLNISKEMGFAQGFDKLITSRYKGATAVNKKILSLKERMEMSKKYFLYIHYMDPHGPYHFQEKFARNALKNERRDIINYDSEISYVDDAIKKLYKEFGWDKDTLIIFTADHGEAFSERLNDFGNPEKGHGKTLNREVLRVPLFFYMRGLKGKEINFNASHLDVLPTLAKLLKSDKRNYWEGDDLSEAFITDKKFKEKFLFSDLASRERTGKPEIHSIIYKNFHYIKTFATPKTKEKEEFFDWKTDPIELKSNLNVNKDLLKTMRTKMEEHLKSKSIFKTETTNVKLDKKTKEHLTTLGYIN